MSTANTILKSVFLLFVLLLASCAGCFETEKSSEQQEVFCAPLLQDALPILPAWGDGQYHDYDATVRKLHTFEELYPHLVDVFSIGTSVLGRDIWCMRLTNEEITQEKRSCLIDGCIHGNEWEAGDACLYLAEYLLVNFGNNRSLSTIANSTTIYIVPLINPDGRQQNTRWNANGIDLNRNFDVDFGRLRGHSLPLGKLFRRIEVPYLLIPRFGTVTNAGRRPFSEPESRAMRELMNDIADHSFSFYCNCHTAVHNFVTPWSAVHPPFAISSQEQAVFDYATAWVADHTEYEDAHLGYCASGTITDWFFKEFRMPAFTFELLSKDFEPWIYAGRHDHLVHWMNTTLPVFLYLLTNIEHLHDWEMPINQPYLPEGVPPPPLH